MLRGPLPIPHNSDKSTDPLGYIIYKWCSILQAVKQSRLYAIRPSGSVLDDHVLESCHNYDIPNVSIATMTPAWLVKSTIFFFFYAVVRSTLQRHIPVLDAGQIPTGHVQSLRSSTLVGEQQAEVGGGLCHHQSRNHQQDLHLSGSTEKRGSER